MDVAGIVSQQERDRVREFARLRSPAEWHRKAPHRGSETLPTGVGGYIPAPDPRAYAVYVDDEDAVWVSDFGANAIHRFDPKTKSFETFSLPSQPGNVRQILGRPGEVWAPESAADQLIVIRRGLG